MAKVNRSDKAVSRPFCAAWKEARKMFCAAWKEARKLFCAAWKEARKMFCAAWKEAIKMFCAAYARRKCKRTKTSRFSWSLRLLFGLFVNIIISLQQTVANGGDVGQSLKS